MNTVFSELNEMNSHQDNDLEFYSLKVEHQEKATLRSSPPNKKFKKLYLVSSLAYTRLVRKFLRHLNFILNTLT